MSRKEFITTYDMLTEVVSFLQTKFGDRERYKTLRIRG